MVLLAMLFSVAVSRAVSSGCFMTLRTAFTGISLSERQGQRLGNTKVEAVFTGITTIRSRMWPFSPLPGVSLAGLMILEQPGFLLEPKLDVPAHMARRSFLSWCSRWAISFAQPAAILACEWGSQLSHYAQDVSDARTEPQSS